MCHLLFDRIRRQHRTIASSTPSEGFGITSDRPLPRHSYETLKGMPQERFQILEPYITLDELKSAVFFGFHSEAARILDSGFPVEDVAMVEVQVDARHSCLSIAASLGHENLVAMLLEAACSQ